MNLVVDLIFFVVLFGGMTTCLVWLYLTYKRHIRLCQEGKASAKALLSGHTLSEAMRLPPPDRSPPVA